MKYLNIEIKARCAAPDRIRRLLLEHKADFKGTDYQTDTYFKVPHGRLKLREGNIENSLIFYNRPNQPEPKDAQVSLYHCQPDAALKTTLTSALGVLVEVKKKREIYVIENVKFHIDEVEDFGSFIEIEAIDLDRTIGREKLLEQCQKYMDLFDIRDMDLVSGSYSDILLNLKKLS